MDGSTTMMELPKCERHGRMELQKPGTREQEYCGTWYRCTRCGGSMLLASSGLKRDLARVRETPNQHALALAGPFAS